MNRLKLAARLTLALGLWLSISIEAHTQDLQDKLDALLDSVYQDHQDALGILIHVESPDYDLSWTRAVGFADSSRTIPLDINQPVLIASNTKTYVSAAILRLVEQRSISLSDPIKGLLGQDTRMLLEGDGYDLSRITIRHLLSHTSGIHDYVDDDYFGFVIENPQYEWTREEQMERAMVIGEPLAESGVAFSYSDINYLLLTEIIETQTQQDFFKAMRSLLNYDSLDLKHTWFKDLEPTPTDLPDFVHQYAQDYRWDSYEINHSWDLYGGGGIASTAKDAALFYQYLFEGKVIEDNGVLKEMYTYVLPEKESKYCLGLYKLNFGYELYYHGDWWGTGVNYSPDTNTSIAVFTLVKDKRGDINPFLGKTIHDIILDIRE
ncbi:MAG: serine hydrolase domain-containing protein [Bacteroidota bacterium]